MEISTFPAHEWNYLEDTYTYHDIFGCSKKPVQNSPREGCVKAIRRGELSEEGICHCLGNNDKTNRDAYSSVSLLQHCRIVCNPRAGMYEPATISPSSQAPLYRAIHVAEGNKLTI